jgi:hypothetical protein
MNKQMEVLIPNFQKHFPFVAILGQRIPKENFYYLKKPFSFVTKGNKPIIRALLIVFAT